MSAYYYFAASLPALVWGQKPQAGKDAFLGECDRLLEEGDAAFVRAAVAAYAAPEPGPDRFKVPEFLGGTALAEWFEWEGSLRAELALLRAQKLGRAFESETRPLRPDAQQAAKAAFDADSPFQAEALLSEARFRAIEQVRALHAWDREGIALYGVALAALERHFAFTEDAGAPRFEAAYAAILATKDSLTGDGR